MYFIWHKTCHLRPPKFLNCCIQQAAVQCHKAILSQKSLAATWEQLAAKYPVGSHSLRSGANAFAKEQGNPWAQETSPFDMTPICRRIFRFPVLRFVFQSSTSHLVVQVGWLTIPENLLDEKGYYKKWHETFFTSSERITSISPKVLPFGANSFFKHLPAFHPHKILNNNKKIHKCLPTSQQVQENVQKSTNLWILLQPSHGFFCFPTSSLLFQTPTPRLDQVHLTEPKPTKVHALTNAAATSLADPTIQRVHTGTYDWSWGCAKRFVPLKWSDIVCVSLSSWISGL